MMKIKQKLKNTACNVKTCLQEKHREDFEDVQKWYFNICFHLIISLCGTKNKLKKKTEE